MSETRKRLATILSLDAAGYSRAAERDDDAAAASVRALRAVISEIIAPFNGRIFNTAGDGFMLEFPSAASGVQAAMALLKASESSEQAVPRIRIGLHLGDVIVEDNGDLLGHGVNIAARLQALAEPGTAIVSETVRAQVRSAAEAPFMAQGRVQLDKMSEKLAVYVLAPGRSWYGKIARRRFARVGGLALVAALLVAMTLLAFNWREQSQVSETPQRLAVLRFEAVGDTPAYFAAGIADELISEVHLINGLEATARSSSFALEGAKATPQGAAEHLGATLVLAGTVQRLTDTIRVRAELVSTADGRQLWTHTFERAPEQIHALQREIVFRVAQAINVRVEAPPPRTVDAEAYRMYLQALEHYEGMSLTFVYDDVRPLLRRAVERDPDFAAAWGLLARAEMANIQFFAAQPGYVQPTATDFAPALEAASKAIALDASLADPYRARALIALALGGWREATEMQDAAFARGDYGVQAFLRTGQFSRAHDIARVGVQLNPLDPESDQWLFYVCEPRGDHACMLATARRAFARMPENPHAFLMLFYALVESGDRDGARELMQTNENILPSVFDRFPPIDRRHLRYMVGDGPPISAEEIASVAQRGASLGHCVAVLLDAGRFDAVGSLLPLWGPENRRYLDFLFAKRAARLRRTLEFWALMEREGLLQYWRESRRWPDFCAQEPVCVAHGGPGPE